MKLIDWNIQNHTTGDWPQRRDALAESLTQRRPTVLCVQEAFAEQVADLAAMLGDWPHAGVGRDDGRQAGEHCAIFYDPAVLSLDEQATFWLSPTPELPGNSWDDYERICTVGRFTPRQGGASFALANTHFPLRPEAKLPSAELLVTELTRRMGTLPLALCGDFNTTPDTAVWKRILRGGFTSAGELAGVDVGPTFHGYEHATPCRIDEVFLRGAWQVGGYAVITDAPGGRRPSDHFGLQVELCAGSSGAGIAKK